jgi:hypothetical protein
MLQLKPHLLYKTQSKQQIVEVHVQTCIYRCRYCTVWKNHSGMFDFGIYCIPRIAACYGPARKRIRNEIDVLLPRGIRALSYIVGYFISFIACVYYGILFISRFQRVNWESRRRIHLFQSLGDLSISPDSTPNLDFERFPYLSACLEIPGIAGVGIPETEA